MNDNKNNLVYGNFDFNDFTTFSKNENKENCLMTTQSHLSDIKPMSTNMTNNFYINKNNCSNQKLQFNDTNSQYKSIRSN